MAVNYVTGPEPVAGKDNRADTAAVVAAIGAAGGRALAVEADVADAAQVAAMVARVAAALGPPDVLVNNAGIETIVPFLELSEAQFQRVLDVNLKGEWLCAQAVARGLVAAGRPGAIVNVASIQAGMALPGRSHYAPSKRAVEALTRNLAAELAPHRIRVNCLNPGLIATDMTAWVLQDPQVRPAVLARIPLGSSPATPTRSPRPPSSSPATTPPTSPASASTSTAAGSSPSPRGGLRGGGGRGPGAPGGLRAAPAGGGQGLPSQPLRRARPAAIGTETRAPATGGGRDSATAAAVARAMRGRDATMKTGTEFRAHAAAGGCWGWAAPRWPAGRRSWPAPGRAVRRRNRARPARRAAGRRSRSGATASAATR